MYELSTSPAYFVFEDLTQRGYSMADRKVGLNSTELEPTLAKLARLHATTATMYKADPTSMKHHNFSNFNERQPSYFPLFENSLGACADQAKKWPGFEKIAAKMHDLKPRLMKKGCQVYIRDESCFNVLTHGDLWVNNIMFQYDEGSKPADVMLIDYAVGFFGSPAIDLSYLLFTSCANELRGHDFDILIQYYHAELSAVLRKLNYPEPRPTLLEIHIEMMKKGIVGLIFAMLINALRVVDDTADADLSSLLLDTETALKFREKMFQHPKYADRMQYLLQYFDRKGYLD
jgi:Ecdysteroid kinase-like family